MDASNKETSANFNNARTLLTGNANSVQVLAEFATSDTDVSPIFNLETLAVVPADHAINNAGISNTVISITNPGAGYNAVSTSGNVVFGGANNTQNNIAQLFRETYLANNFNVGFYYVSVAANEFGTGAEGFAVANTDASNTVNYIVMTSEGSGYIKTPRLNVAIGNAASGMIRAAAVAQGEDGKRGGNILCRYLTRQIALEDGFEAGDLRVFMDVVRPNGTDVHCYYKVLGSEDPERFADKSWVLMNKVVDKKSKDARQVIELQFRPDLLENELKYMENGIQYPIGGKFKYFAVKVCLTAVDTTVAPWVQNLRIIATPEG
jgi:ribosomal protein S11